MGALETLILAVEAGAGMGMAALLGLAAARLRPALASQAGRAMAGLLAGVGLALVLALPLRPLAVLFPLAFLGAAWAAAPLGPPSPRGRASAWAAGAGAAATLSLLAAFDLWWSLPLLALLAGTLLALRRGWRRPGEVPGDERG